MTDVHEPEVRSYNMSRIRSKDTKPEMIVRRFLHKNGLRFRLHVKDLPGKPDIVLPKFKTVIFVNGCFWHGHQNCRYFVKPLTRNDYWIKKIEKNITRDDKAKKTLKELNWEIEIMWECQLKKNSEHLENLLKNLKSRERTLKGNCYD